MLTELDLHQSSGDKKLFVSKLEFDVFYNILLESNLRKVEDFRTLQESRSFISSDADRLESVEC